MFLSFWLIINTGQTRAAEIKISPDLTTLVPETSAIHRAARSIELLRCMTPGCLSVIRLQRIFDIMPPHFSFLQSLEAGAKIGPLNRLEDGLALAELYDDLAHGGSLDLQRDPSTRTIYSADMNATNYGLGATFYAAGYSQGDMISLADGYGSTLTEKRRSIDEEYWIAGYHDAKTGYIASQSGK